MCCLCCLVMLTCVHSKPWPLFLVPIAIPCMLCTGTMLYVTLGALPGHHDFCEDRVLLHALLPPPPPRRRVMCCLCRQGGTTV
jgi:hypothetical protein